MQSTHLRISRTEAIATHGMVNSKHPLAARAGLDILKAGGNAVDAAITTALAQGVVEPMMSGVGGGGFMVFHEAATGQTHVLDYFMRAPRAARPDMFEITRAGAVNVLGYGGVKDNANSTGYRSIGVPGLIAGAQAALERFGTVSLARALEPAIDLAENGFEPNWHHVMHSAQHMDLIQSHPATAAVFLRPGGLLYRAPNMGPGDKLIQRDLARTLRRVADQGAREFYEGETARMITTDFAGHGNLIDSSDLASYQPEWRAVRSTSYRDFDLRFAPGTGGGTLAETFNILEGFRFDGLSTNDAETVHRFIESARIAYADRYSWLSDERAPGVPITQLESKRYANERRSGIDLDRAADSVAAWADAAAPAPEGDGGCTTHLSVVDAQRNMVALTQTINAVWGSGVTAPGTGVLFNNTMVLFDPVPGRKNSIAPGKYPLSSMTPTIVLRHGAPYMTAGAPGGRQIMGAVMRTIHNVLEFGMNPADACANIGFDASAPTTIVDAALGEDVIAVLRARGHRLDVREHMVYPRMFASPLAIVVAGAQLLGGADPHHVGEAMGF